MNKNIIDKIIFPVSTILLIVSLSIHASDEENLLEFDGVIEPNKIVDVGFAADGIISAIEVDRSDFVSAGEELATLESNVEQASLELAREQAQKQAVTDLELRHVNHVFNKRKQKRAEELFAKKAISLQLKDEAKTEAELAKLQLRQAADNKKIAELELARAEEIIKQRTALSPISGVVMERFKSVGEYVEDAPVMRIAELHPLRIEVIIPAEMYGTLNKGMQAVIVPESQPDVQYQAEVVIVDKVIDAASGTFGVRLMLPNPDHKIPGGLKCKVRFTDKNFIAANKIENVSEEGKLFSATENANSEVLQNTEDEE